MTQLEQLRRVPLFGVDKYNEVLCTIAKVEAHRIESRDEYSLQLAALIASNKRLSSDYRIFLRSWIFDPELSAIDSQPSAYLRVLLGSRNIASKEELIEHAPMVISALNWMFLPLDDPKLLKSLLTKLAMWGLDDVYDFFRSKILNEWRERASSMVHDYNVLGEYHSHDDICSAEETLEVYFQSSLLDAGVELTELQLQDLCGNVSVDDIIHTNRVLASRGYWDAGTSHERRIAEEEDMAVVDEVFERDEK